MNYITPTLCLLCLSATITQAQQINYTDIIPDAHVATTAEQVTHPIVLTFDSLTQHDAKVAIIAFGNEIKMATYSLTEVSTEQGGYFPKALNNGEQVGPSGIWSNADSLMGNTLWDGASGSWGNKTDKYLGIRLKKNNQWRYGWIRLDVGNTSSGEFFALVKDFAYNNEANTAIAAGQKNTTGIGALEAQRYRLSMQESQLYIDGPQELVDLSLIDMEGKAKWQRSARIPALIDLQETEKGMYLLRLVKGSYVQTTKLFLVP